MNTRTNKLLSVLLALVLLLSLAPVSALAADHVPVTVIAYDVTNAAQQQGGETAISGVSELRGKKISWNSPVPDSLSFCAWPDSGYTFKEWRVGSVDGSVLGTKSFSEAQNMARSEDYWFTGESELTIYALFEKAAPAVTEIGSVGLTLTLPSTGGSYSGAVPAAVSISSGTGFTVKSANWFNGGTPETNPGCGLAPSSFEAGKPYFAEICLAPAEGYAFADGTAVTIDTLGVKSKAVIDNEVDRMGWLSIVTDDYTMPAAPYTITVNGGKAYKAGGVEITSAAEGDSVYILFDDDAAPAGKYIEWGSAVTEPAVSISAGMISGTEYQAGFIMPAANITVSPDYLDQKSLTVDLTGGTSTDTSAASNAVWSLYRAEDLGLITADISDSHQEKFDLDKDGSWDVTYSTNDSEFSVQDSCSVTGDKTLTIPAAEYSPVTFKFPAAAVPYTVDLSTGKMDLATGQEFADLFNSLGAWTHMSSTSGSSTYYYDLDKDGTEDISVTNSSSSRNVLLLTTSNITTDTYVISDSTGPYNPITFILKAPTVTTYTITLIAYDKTNGTEQAGGEVAFSDSGKGTRISGDYEGNSSRTVGVYPASDYSFAGWAKGSPSGEIVSTSSPYTFTVTEDVTLYALFEKITTYPVWVGGTQVTSANKDDILGDGGKAKFDPDSNTLTLNGLTLNGAYSEAAILVKGIDLTIVGSANVTNTSGAGISSPDPSSGGGITLNGDFTITGTTAIGSYPGVTVSGGTLKATATDTTSRAFSTYSPITISDGLEIIKPEGGKISSDQRTIEDAAGNPATYVEIGPKSVTYPVWVGGEQVTSLNKDDILGDGGKAKFDPDSNTLTLDNPTISGEKSGAKIYIYDNDKTYTIDGTATIDGKISMGNGWNAALVIKGSITTTNSIHSPSGNITVDGNLTVSASSGYGINSGKNLTIQSGTVSITDNTSYGNAISAQTVTISGGTVTATGGDDGIHSYGTVTISGGTVTAKGNDYGIYAGGDVTISGGTVTATGTDMEASGIIGDNVTISGGTVTAKGGSEGIYGGDAVKIENGITKVTADGDTVAINCFNGVITLGDALMIQEPTGGKLSGDGKVIQNADDIDATHAVIVPGEALPKVVGIKVNVTGTQENAGAYDVTTDTLETSFESSTAPVTMSTSFLYTAQACQAEDKLTTAPVAGTPYYFVISIDAYTDGETPTLEWADNDTIKSGSTLTADNGTVEIVEFFHSPAGGSLSVICKYTETSTPTTHTVTFEANGGTPVPAAQTVADGGKATKPADPTKSGVSFGGWYKDSELTEPFDFNTPITADITLYASWNQYIYMLQINKVWEDNDDAAGKRPDSVDVKVLGNGTEIGTVTLTKDEGWKKLYVMATGEADLVLTCEEIVPEGYTLKDMSRTGNTVTLTNQFGVTPPAPTITYSVASGGNSTWTKGSSSGVTIVVKRDPNDAECFSHFASVQIDGATLKNGTDYSAVSGSTVVTFPAATLQGLSDGKHAVTLSFDDGKAVTDLTILAGSTNAGSLVSPRTGDESQPILWIAVLLLSGLGLGGLAVAGRKRRQAGRR